MLDLRVPERGRPPSRRAHVLGGIGRSEDGSGIAGAEVAVEQSTKLTTPTVPRMSSRGRRGAHGVDMAVGQSVAWCELSDDALVEVSTVAKESQRRVRESGARSGRGVGAMSVAFHDRGFEVVGVTF